MLRLLAFLSASIVDLFVCRTVPSTYMYLSVCLCFCLFLLFLCFCRTVDPSVCLMDAATCLRPRLRVCLSVCLSVCGYMTSSQCLQVSRLVILHEEAEDGNAMPNLERPVQAVSRAVSNLVKVLMIYIPTYIVYLQMPV